jgi:hypothetical protein
MHALAIFILYGNVAVALQPPPLAKAKLGLPHPAWMHDAFLMTGMFSSYSKRNADVFIGGERTQEGREQDRGKWIRLPVRDHFPDRHGVVFVRLFAAHHWDVFGPKAQKRAWKELAKRIRARHNRLHPDAPILRVRFGQVDWPQSSRGYRARKSADTVRVQTWHEDRPPKDAPKPHGGAP